MMTRIKIGLLLLIALALQAGENYIRIEFPNGGEILKSGSPVRIRWQTLGINGNMAILLFKSGEQYAIIAESVPNSGAHEWNIPADLPDSGRYRLRICLLNDLRVNDFSDRDFAIKK